MWSSRAETESEPERIPLTPVREESFTSSGNPVRGMTPSNRGASAENARQSEAQTQPSHPAFTRMPSNRGVPRIGESSRSAASSSRQDGDENGSDGDPVDPDTAIPNADRTGNAAPAMAIPTLAPVAAFTIPIERKYKLFRILTFVAASLTNSAEAFNVLLPVIYVTLASLTLKDGMHGISFKSALLLKTSLFMGLPVGSALAPFILTRRGTHEVWTASCFLAVALFSSIALVLVGSGMNSHMMVMIVGWRVILGIGLGGCYTINALTSVNLTRTKSRGMRMAYLVLQRGIGYASAFVSFYWFPTLQPPFRRDKSEVEGGCDLTCQEGIENVWRYTTVIGIFPIGVALLVRLFSMKDWDKAGDKPKEWTDQKSGFREFCKIYRKAQYLSALFAVCIMTFMASFLFFGLFVNLGTIMQRFGYLKTWEDTRNQMDYISMMSIGWALMIGAGVIPGYLVLFALIDFVGRRYMLGLFGIASVFALAALIPMGKYSPKIWIALYCVNFFLQTIGPIGLVYVYATEIFPRKYRGWAHSWVGISGYIGGGLGIVFADLSLNRKIFGGSVDPFQIYTILLLCFGVVILLPAFGFVETRRKAWDLIEGEAYADWHKRYNLDGTGTPRLGTNRDSAGLQ